MAELRPERLIALRKERGLSQAALAREIGVGQSTIVRLEAGGTRNPRELLALASALRCSPEFLLDESDERGVPPGISSPPEPRIPVHSQPSELDTDDVEIDSIDLAYGMGSTFLDVHEADIERERIKFSRNWLRKFTHSPPRLLFATEGLGDSMMPTIHDRDVVVIDRGVTDPTDVIGERIWAIVFAGMGSLKRLRPLPDGTVRIMSDNQAIRDEIASDGDLHVIGRVVAVVKRQ